MQMLTQQAAEEVTPCNSYSAQFMKQDPLLLKCTYGTIGVRFIKYLKYLSHAPLV